MTIDEIFEELKQHLIGGMMFHDEMANYYDFLGGFRGYKRAHEYHFLKESIMMRKLERHYMAYHHALIKDKQVADPQAIPSAWFGHNQKEISGNTRQNAIKSGIEEWVKWESAVKSRVHELYKEAMDVGDAADVMFIERMLCEVTKELKCAQKKHLELESVSYDMPYIVGEQKCLHDKYKKKTAKIGKLLW